MFRQVMPLLFFFIVLPTLIYGLNCGAGGTCYGSKDVGTPFALTKKDCPDACVSFKCFVDEQEVMEGAGCYEDFANACKSTRTEIKDQIKKNLQNYTVRENDVYFTSCSDKDGCATNGFDPWIIKNSVDEKFGDGYKNVTDLACKYDNKPTVPLTTMKCNSTTNCESGYGYGIKPEFIDPIYDSIKTCDACIKFTCTLDGKTVTTGYGCYEDFEKACKFLDDEIKQNVKRNIKDSFYYDKNYFIFSCSDSDNCQLFPSTAYSKVNYNAEKSLIFDENSTETCDQKMATTTTTSKPVITTTPTPLPPKETTITPSFVSKKEPQDDTDQTDASEVFTTINPSPSGAPNGQFDALKLQKIIIIFGFILIYLWL